VRNDRTETFPGCPGIGTLILVVKGMKFGLIVVQSFKESRPHMVNKSIGWEFEPPRTHTFGQGR
jgi:hypothetical protein